MKFKPVLFASLAVAALGAATVLIPKKACPSHLKLFMQVRVISWGLKTMI